MNIGQATVGRRRLIENKRRSRADLESVSHVIYGVRVRSGYRSMPEINISDLEGRFTALAAAAKDVDRRREVPGDKWEKGRRSGQDSGWLESCEALELIRGNNKRATQQLGTLIDGYVREEDGQREQSTVLEGVKYRMALATHAFELCILSLQASHPRLAQEAAIIDSGARTPGLRSQEVRDRMNDGWLDPREAILLPDDLRAEYEVIIADIRRSFRSRRGK